MKRMVIPVVLIALPLLSFDGNQQGYIMFNGVATDGYRNRLVGVSAVIKGTPTGNVTDLCGRFSLPIVSGEFTVTFHGMSYADLRTYEIKLRSSDLTSDTIVFQLGHLKQKNPDCGKVSKKLKRYVIE